MAASVVPYEVNSPLWSDGADKQRGMALPTGGKIHVKNCATHAGRVSAGRGRRRQVGAAGRHRDGQELPVRRQAGRDAPVRPLRRHDLGRLHATSGTRRRPTRRSSPTSASRSRSTPARARSTWHIPSRDGLHDLPHATTGGSTLGPETAQMNRVVGTAEPDRSVQGAGPVRDRAPATPYKTALRRADGDGRDRSRSARARTCTRTARFCHRPDDANFANIDLRRDVAFKDTNTCGVDAREGQPGRADAR